MSNITEFPKKEQADWHMPFHEADRVVIEGRMIPKLTARPEGDDVAIILDGRLSISVPKALGRQVAWLVANALAIGEGYPYLGAETKDRPFAPQSMQIEGIPS